MKITLPGFIHAKLAESWESPHHMGHVFEFFRHDDMSDHGRVNICPYVFEFEIPDDWNPIPDDIANLRKKQQEIRAKAQAECDQIEHFIGKLSAIEYKEPA